MTIRVLLRTLDRLSVRYVSNVVTCAECKHARHVSRRVACMHGLAPCDCTQLICPACGTVTGDELRLEARWILERLGAVN